MKRRKVDIGGNVEIAENERGTEVTEGDKNIPKVDAEIAIICAKNGLKPPSNPPGFDPNINPEKDPTLDPTFDQILEPENPPNNNLNNHDTEKMGYS